MGTNQICKKQGHSASRCFFHYSKSNNNGSNNSANQRPSQMHLSQVQENEIPEGFYSNSQQKQSKSNENEFPNILGI